MAITRRACRTRRVGHAGTLDPFATGLLLLLIGRATRLARYLVGLPKSYDGLIRLGATTTTDDPTGQTVDSNDRWSQVDDLTLSAAMASLMGEREQRPPVFSAKRVAGERAHRLARRGTPMTPATQRIAVHQFELLQRRGPDLEFRATVGSGTYIRSLARELGENLGCGAHLAELRRTVVGPFRLEEAVSLETVRAGGVPIHPPAAALRHVPTVSIGPGERDRLARGQAVPATQSVDGPVALLCQGQLVAVAQPHEGEWHPEVVLLP